MFGDYADGSKLRPLRAITEFDPLTGTITASRFECEVYSPNGNLIQAGKLFIWQPSDPTEGETVKAIVSTALVGIMKAEGLGLYGT